MLQTTSTFQPALRTAYEEALAFVQSLAHAPVGATADAATLRETLFRPLEDGSIDAVAVVEELVRDVEGGILGMPSGRFFGWVIGGALPAALAADWLTSAWDQNAALYACGPAAAIAEEAAGAWLKDLLQLPPAASFALVTGCQMAHVTCLAAARHALLERCSWNVEERGLYAAPPIKVVTSANRHASIDRAVKLLGLGTQHIELLEPNADETMNPQSLRRALQARPHAPAVAILAAGDINTGAFDSFEELIPIAKELGAWVHVDGAFGLWAAASPRYRGLLAGVEAADSWATDGHKWLNVPFDCGYAFVADAQAHRAAMSTRAPYIAQTATARDQIDWNPDWSRRARGFSTYAAIRQLGRSGIADLIERSCRHAAALVAGIGSLEGAEVLWHPIINQGLVRFKSTRRDATPAEHDARTEEVIDRIVRSGQAYFGPTTWRGMRAMRVSVLNWQTSDVDVSRAVAAVANALSG